MQGDSGGPVSLVCVLRATSCTRDCGWTVRPASPTPSVWRGRKFKAYLGRFVPRDCGRMFLRHCERSEAIHSFLARHDGLLRFARNDDPQLIGCLTIEL